MGSFVLAIMWFFSYTCHESANSPFCAHLHLIWSFSTASHVYLYFHLGAWSFLYACFDNRAKQISQMDIKKKTGFVLFVQLFLERGECFLPLLLLHCIWVSGDFLDVTCVVWCLLCLTDKFHQRDSKQTFEFLSFMRQKKLNSVKNPGVFLFCLFFCSSCHLTGQSSNMQLTLKGHLLFYSGAKRSTHEHTAARDSHTKGWPLTKRPISSAIQDQV